MQDKGDKQRVKQALLSKIKGIYAKPETNQPPSTMNNNMGASNMGMKNMGMGNMGMNNMGMGNMGMNNMGMNDMGTNNHMRMNNNMEISNMGMNNNMGMGMNNMGMNNNMRMHDYGMNQNNNMVKGSDMGYGMSNQYVQMKSIQPKMEPKPISRIDTEEDFRKMPYQGKAKYDNELKALNALKSENPQVSQKPKKMFFQHYDTSEPYTPNIPNNPNPSGRPPNIPPEMYQGIVVKPKRPWVYLGTENLPPIQYQQINDNTFKSVQRRVIDDNKKDQIMARRQILESKPKKKGGKRAKQESMMSDGEDSGFEMSDQIDMSGGDSVFASDYRSQSRINRKSAKNSEFNEEDPDMSEGTETKKRQQSIFNDSQGSEDQGMSSKYDSKSRQSKGRGRGKPRGKGRSIKSSQKDEDEEQEEELDSDE